MACSSLIHPVDSGCRSLTEICGYHDMPDHIRGRRIHSYVVGLYGYGERCINYNTGKPSVCPSVCLLAGVCPADPAEEVCLTFSSSIVRISSLDLRSHVRHMTRTRPDAALSACCHVLRLQPLPLLSAHALWCTRRHVCLRWLQPAPTVLR